MSSDSIHTSSETPRWYALKVFYNKVIPLRDELEPYVADSYFPLKTEIVEQGGHRQKVVRPMVASLLFVRMVPDRAAGLQHQVEGRALVYTRHTPAGSEPAPIPDGEMELFKFVTSAGHEGVEYLGADSPRYHAGDRVRVTAGPFKGAEGHIVRIRNNRRLIVSIQGLCAVATGYIPAALLEPVEKNPLGC
ncbi:MAG: UpxY family transcription antiterminator [Muribaculaceae bacterium]|nr:UpxY family transcription antiterminator [Muribaculaceae bacterium]